MLDSVIKVYEGLRVNPRMGNNKSFRICGDSSAHTRLFTRQTRSVCQLSVGRILTIRWRESCCSLKGRATIRKLSKDQRTWLNVQLD